MIRTLPFYLCSHLEFSFILFYNLNIESISEKPKEEKEPIKKEEKAPEFVENLQSIVSIVIRISKHYIIHHIFQF